MDLFFFVVSGARGCVAIAARLFKICLLQANHTRPLFFVVSGWV